MSKRSPSRQVQHQFVAVIDLGAKADYRTEVRHQVEAVLPFRLTSRSGVRQLDAAYRQVRMALRSVLTPAAHDDLLVWMLEDGQPNLFVSGLRNTRHGNWTKQMAATLDAEIRPQVGQSQSVKNCQFLLRATAHTWGCSEEFCDEDASEEDREYGVLDGILGWFDHCELLDSDPSDPDDVYVCGEVWHRFTLDLPFNPGKASTPSQLGYLEHRATDLLHLDLYDVQVEELDVWLLDESGQPVECLTGWSQVKAGHISAAQMRKWSRHHLERLPLSLRSQAA